MHRNSRDSWADAMFWGVTFTILMIIIGVPLAFYFVVAGR
ncbi:MAG: hypothetical protein K0Q72_3069 [Armatimonadetes bacterium]|jgi:hypothetical protein|nr:hypothetical protein [Armatimonadota bacterium]